MLVADLPSTTTREKILNVTADLIRQRGYAATSVADICQAAKITKGAFFHHFASKDDMGVAVAAYWRVLIERLFANAPYHRVADPVEKLLAYIDFRKAILDRSIAAFTCLVGVLVNETYATHPTIRAACAETIDDHALTLAPVIAEAMAARNLVTTMTPNSLAMFIHGTLQGAFVLAKAHDDPKLAHDCLDHLSNYLEYLFAASPKRAPP
jgi:TetR/AcrR family transcriptional repressor of nem operon